MTGFNGTSRSSILKGWRGSLALRQRIF